MESTITITLPPTLYELAQTKLIDSGFFSDFEDIVKTGVRQLLLEWATSAPLAEPPNLTAAERYMFYLHKLQHEIGAVGGLFPHTAEEDVLETLRQTREQIYAEKYAAHFGHQ